MSRGIVGFEHGVEDPFDEADLVWRMYGGQLCEVVAVGIDQSVDSGPSRLMEGAADFEIEGRDGVVSGSNEAIQICFRDIFGEAFLLFYTPVSLARDEVRNISNLPFIDCMAAINGFASSKVRVPRALNACRNARLEFWYRSASLSILRIKPD